MLNSNRFFYFSNRNFVGEIENVSIKVIMVYEGMGNQDVKRTFLRALRRGGRGLEGLDVGDGLWVAVDRTGARGACMIGVISGAAS